MDAHWDQHDTHVDLKFGGYMAYRYQWCWNALGQPVDCTNSVDVYAIYYPVPQNGGGCIWRQPDFYHYTIRGLQPQTTYDFRMFIWLAKYVGDYDRGGSCVPPKLVLPPQTQNIGNYCIVPSSCRATTLPGNPGPPPRGGSPRVMLYDASGNWVKETNVLPQSESYRGPNPPDWEDAMQFRGTPNGAVGSYMVEIHEYENALNAFDRITLTTVDYPRGYSVAVAPDGSVHTYSKTASALSAVNGAGKSVLTAVKANDGKFYQGPDGDTLTVGFGAVSGARQKILIGSRDYVITGCNCYKMGVPVQVQSLGGQWTTVTTLYPRVDSRVQVLDLTGLFSATGIVNVRFLLSSRQQIDWVGLDRSANQALTLTTVLPTQLNYSDGSFADLERIKYDDGTYVSLSPGQFVFLTFPKPPQASAFRALVLRVNGYYTLTI